MKPLVSVVLTVYDEEDDIADTVRSITDQEFKDFELLIIDDGSHDGTLQKLEPFLGQDERVILVAQEHSGRSAALNNGVSHAQGEYIAIMDSGDSADPQRLARQVEFLEQGQDITMVGTWAHWVAKDGSIVGEWRSPARVDRRNVFRAGGLVHSSIMCRRELFASIGAYDLRLTSAVDNDLFIRAVRSGAVLASIPEFLMRVSRRPTGICGNARSVEKNVLRVKLRHLPHLLSVRNVAYTMVTLATLAVPSFLLRSRWLNRLMWAYTNRGRNSP